MKRIISISVLLLGIALSAFTQINRAEGKLGIAAYNGAATIAVKESKLILSKHNLSDTFLLKKEANATVLANDADSAAVYNKLELTPLQLNQALTEQAGANAIAKLIDIAARMQGQQLQIVPGEANALSPTDSIEEGAKPATLVEESSNNNWLMPTAIGLIALVLGILVGRITKKTNTTNIVTNRLPEEPKMATTAEPEESIVKVESKQMAQLKKDLAAALEKNNLITEKTQKLLEGDNLYYNAIFEQLILPLQTALDNGDEAAVVKYAHLAMVHFSSITRVKIRKKQKYDDANIQLITGNASLTQEFPQIDAQTPIDKIPANLRILMNILQKNGVTGLDETVIKGYKLKQL